MKLNANDRASLRVFVTQMIALSKREYDMAVAARPEAIDVDYLKGKSQGRLESAHDVREFFNLDMDEGKS